MTALQPLRFLPVLLYGTLTAWGLGPVVGGPARDFTLKSLGGGEVSLSKEVAKGSVVLVVLRGFPGYQCPVCNRQVRELLNQAKSFSDAKVRVLLVYPGPAALVKDKAQEFAVNKQMPAHFDLLLDPDYEFTNSYGLRWDAPKETAYPSTFVIDRSGVVRFAKVSQTHGGRASAAEILEALQTIR